MVVKMGFNTPKPEDWQPTGGEPGQRRTAMTTTTNHATAADFANWTAAAKRMSEDQLEFAVQDCRAAEIAMRGWNPVKERYYADQVWTYAGELRKRRLPKIKKNKEKTLHNC
jgi:hypothetical protein